MARARAAAVPPLRIPFTGDDAADRLIAEDPFALLTGFVLDQQFPLQRAFRGPLVIRERLGTLDPAAIARRPAGQVARAFATPPAVHRFPTMMAGRVQALAKMVVTEYGGAADRVWLEAADGPDLARRLGRLPGFGPMKVRTVVTLLGRQFGVRPRGWELLVPPHPTLGDVTSSEELAQYQAAKRAHRAAANMETPTSRNRHKLPSGAQPR